VLCEVLVSKLSLIRSCSDLILDERLSSELHNALRTLRDMQFAQHRFLESQLSGSHPTSLVSILKSSGRTCISNPRDMIYDHLPLLIFIPYVRNTAQEMVQWWMTTSLSWCVFRCYMPYHWVDSQL
jgi:hypothetical protein